MSETKIEFTDGAAYEDYMGVWSRLVGDAFLDWLAPAPGLRWLDVGCGNGAFTQLIADRCAPASLAGIDPSGAQIAFAKRRFPAAADRFQIGDAMALPQAAASFDVAVMPLVIFFVPDPFKGVAEMARVVAPGGWVTAYGWDLIDGGFPYDAVREELIALGQSVPLPPSPDAARFERLRAFWSAARLTDIATTEISVQRTFASADAYWDIVRKGPSVGGLLSALPADRFAALQARVEARFPKNAAGGFTCAGRAHAIRGRVPA